MVLSAIVVMLTGAGAGAGAGRSMREVGGARETQAARGVVAKGSLLVADLSGRVFVLSRAGRRMWGVPGSLKGTVQALAVSRDRQHAYASFYMSDGGFELSRLTSPPGRNDRSGTHSVRR